MAYSPKRYDNISRKYNAQKKLQGYLTFLFSDGELHETPRLKMDMTMVT